MCRRVTGNSDSGGEEQEGDGGAHPHPYLDTTSKAKHSIPMMAGGAVPIRRQAGMKQVHRTRGALGTDSFLKIYFRVLCKEHIHELCVHVCVCMCVIRLRTGRKQGNRKREVTDE